MELPKLLQDYLETTDQPFEGYAEGQILNEAEWVLYNAEQRAGSAAYEGHPQSKKALRRFVEEFRGRGIAPETAHLR